MLSYLKLCNNNSSPYRSPGDAGKGAGWPRCNDQTAQSSTTNLQSLRSESGPETGGKRVRHMWPYPGELRRRVISLLKHRRLPQDRYRGPDADQRRTQKPSLILKKMCRSYSRGDRRRWHVSFHNEARGGELRYLPEYPPDLDPIKSVFHPPKALLRKAAERTVSGMGDACAPSFEDSNLPNA